MIDIGANLTNSCFSEDIQGVLQRAKSAGVSAIIVTGTNIKESFEAAKLCLDYPGYLYATAGCHPHDASDFKASDLTLLKELSKREEIVAIGECGLDFNRNYSPPEIQIDVFHQQLQLATELGLPVFLHQRDAHDKFCKILEEYRSKLIRVVVHCFTNGIEELNDYLDLDCYIGVTGWVCDERRGKKLQQAVPLIPENRLLIETDSPFLMPRNIKPKPKKSKNEPMYLEHVCKVVSELRGVKPEWTRSVTESNSRKFFNI